MSKKQVILPWTLVFILAAALIAGAVWINIKPSGVSGVSSSGKAESSSAASSSEAASSAAEAVNVSSRTSSEDSSFSSQSDSISLKSDIELAAQETQILNSSVRRSTRLENEATYVVPSTGKYVYLTFDDGPSENTPGVLDILKKNNVPATFFVVYNKNQDYYKQIVAGGHTLALHTYTHDYRMVYASLDAYFYDLHKISDYVQQITGIKSNIVRLPGGSSNTISRHYCKGVMTSITSALTSRGYLYYDWNAQCVDATSPGISASEILHNVKSFTVADGVQKPFIMLLLHNGSTETTTKEALQSIIDYYRDNGYTFLKITDDTPAVHQVVAN